MAVSSLLGYYCLLYGPQILLQMNIAYFLPSIPLLVGSSLLDDWLDATYGALCQLACMQFACAVQVMSCQLVWIQHASRRPSREHLAG